MINCKRFSRKQSWLNDGNILAVVYRLKGGGGEEKKERGEERKGKKKLS
jgi:hypothetical protein